MWGLPLLSSASEVEITSVSSTVSISQFSPSAPTGTVGTAIAPTPRIKANAITTEKLLQVFNLGIYHLIKFCTNTKSKMLTAGQSAVLTILSHHSHVVNRFGS